MIVVDLRHVGTTAWLSGVWRYLLDIRQPVAAQSFSTRQGMLSGPAALHGLILDRVLPYVSWERQSAWSLGGVAVFVQVCHSAFQTVNKSGWVHRGGMCHHHRPVAGACSQWWSEWLATGFVCLCCLWSDCWFFEHMTVLHFWCHRTDWLFAVWRLLYLLIWIFHLWSLAAHEHLLSSTASGLHVWWWSWWLSHHQCTFWCKQSQFSVLLQVCVVVVGGRLFKHVPVCALKAVL